MHFKGFLSLILVEKELNFYVLNRTLIIADVSYFVHSKVDICSPRKKSSRKKKRKSFLPTNPNFFQVVTWTTHIFLFGLTIYWQVTLII